MFRKLYYLVGIAGVAWGWHHVRQMQLAAMDEPGSGPGPSLSVERPDDADPGYRCDGRVYCSQMHSCEEATWFLEHCAGTEMDGDRDGIPCERQFCDRR